MYTAISYQFGLKCHDDRLFHALHERLIKSKQTALVTFLCIINVCHIELSL